MTAQNRNVKVNNAEQLTLEGLETSSFTYRAVILNKDSRFKGPKFNRPPTKSIAGEPNEILQQFRRQEDGTQSS